MLVGVSTDMELRFDGFKWLEINEGEWDCTEEIDAFFESMGIEEADLEDFCSSHYTGMIKMTSTKYTDVIGLSWEDFKAGFEDYLIDENEGNMPKLLKYYDSDYLQSLYWDGYTIIDAAYDIAYNYEMGR